MVSDNKRQFDLIKIFKSLPPEHGEGATYKEIVMNKSYRSIWNEALGAWVAVSEIETAKGKPVGSGVECSDKNRPSAVRMAVKVIPLSLCMILGGFILPGSAMAANTVCAESTAPASGVDNAVACGPGANAASNRSVAVGFNAQAATGGNVSSVAVGPLARSVSAAAAFGVAAEATGSGSVAFGSANLLRNDLPENQAHTKTVASGQNSIAIGTGAKAIGLRSTVIGDHANSSDAVVGGVALGMASVADRAAAVGGFLSGGRMATASADTAMPVDPVTGAQALQAGLTATASTAGAVSIGGYTPTTGNPAGNNYVENVALYRQITNLAGGTADTDAVNMAQLKAAVTRYYSVNDGGTRQNNYINDGASALNSLAAGVAAQAAAVNATAVGHLANASADNATVLGNEATATAKDTVAIGQSADAVADSAVAVGKNAQGAGNFTVSIGLDSQATSDGAVAMGSGSAAEDTYTVAIGNDAKALQDGATALGRLAKAEADKSLALGTESRVTTIGVGGVAAGENALVDSTKGIAIGSGAQAVGQQGSNIAIGEAAKTDASGAIVIGARAKTTDGQSNTSAVVIGTEAIAKSKDAVGIGYQSVVEGASSVTLGSKTQTAKAQAVAVGYSAAASGYQSVALGASARTGDNAGSSVAIGREASATVANGVALGSGSVASLLPGLIGVDPLDAVADRTSSIWRATTSAVSVGKGTEITRQITSVAAGTQDTDAVNVAQLKAAGFKFKTTNSTGQASGSSEEKVKNGDLFVLDAGKNIALTQSGKTVSIATKDAVEFTSVTAGANVLDGTAINVGGQTYTNVAAAINALATGSSASATHYFNVNSSDRSDESNYNNDGATGNDALAAGKKAKASAAEAVAVGSDAIASGMQSLALGNKVVATHLGATAVGNNAKAENVGAQAFGQSSEARGENSAAVGRFSVARGNRASAFGVGNTASGASSFSGGDQAVAAGAQSIALGLQSNVAETGSSAIAIGTSATAAATNSVVIGSRASITAAGSGSVAVGAASKANGVNATAVGQASEASGQNSFAGGQDSHATGKSTVAVGDGAKATKDSAVAVGAYAHAGPEAADLVKDPNAGAGSAAFGYNSRASTYRSLALGSASSASGGNSAVAVGDTAKAAAGDALAIGTQANSSAAQAVALGRQASASIAGGVAIGYMSKTEADKGVTGADPLGAIDDKSGKTWTSTRAAVAVGDVAGGTTRQITGLAAGTQDTDAVNVAQLKAAGFKITTSKSAGEAKGSKVEKVQNGATVTFDAGKNIELTQTDAKISIATKDDVVFDSVAVGSTRIDNAGINAGNKVVAEVADGQNETDAVNKRQLDAVAAGGWNLRNNSQQKDLVKQNDVVDFVNGEGTTAVVETTGVNSSTVKFSVNKTGLSVSGGTVSAQNTGDAFATAADVAKAINDAEKTSSVAQGNNTRVVTDAQGNHTTYTVHAEKTTVSGSEAVKVTPGEKSSSDVTDYAVDLTEIAKADIQKGVEAKAAVDSKGLKLADGKGGTSSVKKLDESFTVSGDSNITTTANSDGIQIQLNPELTVTSLTAGSSKLNSDGLTIEGGPSVTKAGIDAAGKKITKVAAGEADDDAVNVSQLKDSDNIAKGNMAALGGSYDAATDTYTQPSYVVKNTEGAAKPTVHTVQEALTSLSEEIEKPLTFVADKGTDSARKLGSTVGIKAGNFAGAASADNLVTENDGNGTITVKLADNPTFKGKVTAQGLDAGDQQITGVARGQNGTDAVNVEQLQQAMKDLTVENLSLVAADSPFSYINDEGEQLIRKVDEKGKAYFVKAADGQTRYEGTDVVVSALNATDPQTTVATRVTNVAKGTKDTDAVNTAQLKDVLTALGTTLGEDGTPVKPVYAITRADGSPVATVNTVGEALGHLNTVLKDPITVSGNTNNGTSTIVQGGSDQKLGSKLQIKGALVDGTSSAANIRTVVTDGAVEIQLADNPVFAGKVRAQGLDAGNQQITGVGEGTAATDAVNKAQLDKVLETVNSAWDLTANGRNLSKVAPGESVDLNNTDNNIDISKSADNNNVTFNLARNLNIDSVTAGDSVLSSDGLNISGGPSVTKAGINAAGTTVSNIAAGKNAADAVNVSQLSPLAKALGVTVNPASGTVAAPEFIVTKADGSKYTAAGTVQEALNNIGNEIRKPLTFAGDNGSGNFERTLGTAVNLKGGADAAKLSERNIGVVGNGTDTLDIKLAKELTGLTSAEFTDEQGGRSMVNGSGVDVRSADGQKAAKLDSDGLHIENGPALTKNGLDAADTVIRNVAAGEVAENSKDAVNGGQLHAQGKGVERILGGETRYNPADGTYTNNNIGGTGKNNLDEAIASVRATAGAGWNLTAEGENSSNVAAGETVDLRSTDKNIVITKTAGNDQVSFDLADAVTADSLTTGGTVVNNEGVKVGETAALTSDGLRTGDTAVNNEGVKVGETAALTSDGLTLGNAKNGKAPVVLTSDGLNNGGNTVTNIAAGKNSGDAVNVSQLTPLATALGMAFDEASGTVRAPAFTVTRTDGSTYPAVNTVQGALDHIGTEIRKPLRFTGNSGTTERKLDETLIIKGSLADSAQASDKNIRTKVEGGTLTIELAESPKFGGVTINDNGKITGVEAGNTAEGSKEAVNGGQLYAQGKGVESIIGGDTVYNPETGSYTAGNIGGTGAGTISDAIAAVKNTANAGWNLTAQGKNSSNVQPGETVDLRNNDGNIVVTKTDADDTVAFDLAKTLKVDAVKTGATTVNDNGVAVGDNVALASDGLKVANPASGKTVSLGSNGLNNGGNVITGLANGAVAQGSQEAVTGDQLFAVQEQAKKNLGEIEKGLNFTGNSGNFNRKMGETVNVKGGLANTDAASADNIRTAADSKGNIEILLADAPTFKGKLSAQGLDAGGQRITGVQKGAEDSDAVNVEQLREAMINASVTTQTVINANAPFSYVNGQGEMLVRSVEADGTVKFHKASDGQEYADKDISIAALNAQDPQSAVPTVLGNIADGKKANDAANISQLSNAVKALGGGAAVNPDGSIKAPAYTVNKNDGTVATVGNVGDALNLINAEINKPLTFAGDNKDVKVTRSLDTELAVKGGATGKLTENNIGVTGSTDDNSLSIQLAESINLGETGSVTAGNTVLNGNGVAVGGNVALTSDGLKAGDVKVTYEGINAGGKKITGVKAGEEATDAVNKAQLDAVQAAANSKVAAQGNLTVKESTNDDGSTTYTLATADDVNFNSVTSGKGDNQVVLDGKGVNVGGQTYITAQGVNANGHKVANVGKGSINAASTDAVNGSQLYGTAASVARIFGGDATVNADGSVQMTNIGGTGAATVEDAIKAVNQAVTVSKVAVVQGDNIVVDKTTNADGSSTYKVSTAKDLKADSVSVGGNTTINGNGISIANGPSLSADGLNAAGKKVTNVADGEISATSKDAVNGSQLYQAYQVLGGNNTSINMKDAPGSTAADGSTVPAGTVTTVVTQPDGTQTTTVETNQKVAVSTDKGGNQYTLTTYNVEGQNTYVTNDVIQAIGKMNEQGIKFFHTNDGEVKAVAQGSNTEDSSASGAYATAIGYQTSASGQGAVALGNTYTATDKDGQAKQQRTQATGKNAVAIGTGSQANNENTIAIGTGNIVNGRNSGAIGDPSVINGNNTYAVGNNNTVNGNNTFVLGNSVTETIDNSVVLGNEAAAKGVHTTAGGGHYTFAGANDANVAGVNDVVGVVSVGKEGQTRQVQNVAAGVVSPTSTDAINGSQLYHTNEAINSVANYSVNMGNQLNQRIGDVESKSNAGTAAAMAVAGLPQAYLPGKSMMAVSGSTYRGESGYAVGFSSISDNGNWVVKGTATGNSRGHYGATAGVGYQW